MSERIWDGRGEALDDARLTTADGRMADDLRLKGLHFRVMAHVGRQNHRRGWLRVSQTELAERWDCHRVALNRTFKDLVEWRYLLQRTQEEAGESFCLYKVALDGETDDGAAPVKPATVTAQAEGGVKPTGYTPPGGGCNVQVTPVKPMGYTGVAPEVTPPSERVIATRAHRLSPTDADKDSPPPPQGGASAGPIGDDQKPDDGWARGWSEAAQGVVAGLRANGSLAHVVASFIDLVRGTLRPQKGADAAAFVRQLAHRLRDIRPEALARAAQVLLDTRGGYLPDAATIERTAKAAEAALRAEASAADARGTAAPAGDPALTARWPQMRAALAAALGEQVTRSWFDGLVLVRLEAGVLTIAADSPFKARWIGQHHETALRDAARAVLGPVSRVVIRSGRDAGSQAQGAAA